MSNRAATVHLLKRPVKRNGTLVHYWALRYYDSRGRERRKSIGRVDKITQRQAKAARDKLMADLTSGEVKRDAPCKHMKLGEFLAFHAAQRKTEVRPSTMKEWRIAGDHVVRILGDVRIDRITWSDARTIRDNMDNVRDATRRKTLVVFKSMLQWAVDNELLDTNPFVRKAVRKLIGPPPARVKRIFSDDEIQGMLDAAPDLRWVALIRLGVTSGLRKSELLHLRWSDFDRQAGTIRVQKHDGRRFTTDNGQNVPIVEWSPKTTKSTRSVPIPPDTILELLKWERQADGSPYIFIDTRRLRLVDARLKAGSVQGELLNNFNRTFERVQRNAARSLADANWPENLGCFHDLRKTFATRAASNGVPMHELQRHLGHSSIKTTADFYADVDDVAAGDRLRQVWDKVA